MGNDTQPIHPLRQRMIEDMTLRGHSPGTQRHYIRTVRACCSHLGIKPGDLTGELARSYLLYLQGTDVSYMTINGQATALRFFLRVTLGRREDVERVPLMARAKLLPAVLTPEEVARIIAAAPGLKYKTALSVTYGAGLRASETANLKVSDVDNASMTLRIEHGKGNKDRKAKLSPQLLETLRKWWQVARPQYWLFPSRKGLMCPISTRQLSRQFSSAVEV